MPSGPFTDALLETLATFDAGGPPLTTVDVADRLGLGRRSTYDRLDRLVDRDELETKKVGSSGRVWWRPLERSNAPTSTSVTAKGHTDDDEGSLQGDAEVSRDVAARREREQMDRHERDLLAQILETSPIAIGVFHPDGSVDRTNSRLDELIGPVIEDAEVDPSGGGSPGEPEGAVGSFLGRIASRVGETGEPVTDREVRIEDADHGHHWLSVNATPLSDGGSVQRVVTTTTEVTRRKEQARRLERRRDELEAELDDVFDRISDGVYGLDEQLRFTYLNERAEGIFDLEESSILGHHIQDELFLTDRFEAALEESLEDRIPVFLEDYYGPFDAWFENALYPSETGVSVYFRDITERKQREQELEEYERIVETVDDGVYVLDEAGRFRRVNEAFLAMTRSARSELIGTHASTVFGEKFDDIDAAARRLFESGVTDVTSFEEEIYIEDDDPIVVESRFTRFDVEGGHGRVGVVREITDRLERERDLERYRTIVETVDDGIYSVDGDGRFTLVNEAYAEMTGYPRGEILGAHVSKIVDDETAETAHEIERELVHGERETAKFEATLDTASGGTIHAEATFVLLPHEDGDHERIAVVRDVTERVEREQGLKRQRERLAALDGLNRVVRDLTEAVIDQSTRAEIERVVCEDLAATESYEFALIGEVDPQTQTFAPRTEAGVEGYLDHVTISVDPDDPRSAGPTGRAVQTGEMQVSGNVAGGEVYAAWHEHAREWNFQSSAAIPIVHEGVLYGVLNVYADRPHAFGRDEGEVIGHLGEIVGHAISAVERKRALTSDEVVEFEFHVPGGGDAFDASSADGRLTFEEAVPVDDSRYLMYGTVTDDMLEGLESMMATRSHWESVRLLGEIGEGLTQFELRLVDPPVLSEVTALGGYVDLGTIEDGDYYLRVHMAPDVDPRGLIDLVQESFPSARLLSRQQISRNADSRITLLNTLESRLTDRQRQALEAAYFAGYFEWPRNLSGEDVAESLGVSGPTFHQHLRDAQRKLLEAVLEGGSPMQRSRRRFSR